MNDNPKNKILMSEKNQTKKLTNTLYSSSNASVFKTLFTFLDIVSYIKKMILNSATIACKISMLIRELDKLNSNERFHRIHIIILINN